MRSLNGSNIVHVKNRNRQAILQQLLRTPLSRVEIAHNLHLSATTVTNIINELLAEGWVIPPDKLESGNVPAVTHSRGRPRIRLSLNPNAASVIGVHVGIGTYRIVQTNLLGISINSVENTFDLKENAASSLNKIADSIQHLRATSPQISEPILGIGFGASGLVDADEGVNIYAPSLGWQDVPVAQILQSLTALPVLVENNVRAMALAEAYFGQGRDIASLAVIFGRIGIGAGLVMNGRLIHGLQAGAGEIGHTTIVPVDGARCRCGQHGCLETLVTQPTLWQNLTQRLTVVEKFAEANFTNPVEQFEAILHLARNGDPEVLQEIEQIATYLSIALSNLVNTLNPERIILGGMYAQGADLFLPLLRQNVAQLAFANLGEQVQIESSTFGLDAGVIGAASVALVNLFYEANGSPLNSTQRTLHD